MPTSADFLGKIENHGALRPVPPTLPPIIRPFRAIETGPIAGSNS
jgi:hypothetical protein